MNNLHPHETDCLQKIRARPHPFSLSLPRLSASSSTIAVASLPVVMPPPPLHRLWQAVCGGDGRRRPPLIHGGIDAMDLYRAKLPMFRGGRLNTISPSSTADGRPWNRPPARVEPAFIYGDGGVLDSPRSSREREGEAAGRRLVMGMSPGRRGFARIWLAAELTTGLLPPLRPRKGAPPRLLRRPASCGLLGCSNPPLPFSQSPSHDEVQAVMERDGPDPAK
jgi:hypothetical protein